MIVTKIFARNYEKNNACNNRCLVDKSFVPATQSVILKIVRFLITGEIPTEKITPLVGHVYFFNVR